MREATFELRAADGLDVVGVRWLPADGAVRAAVQIAHGMAEHAARYARLAGRLTARGWAVYAHDHRGHGRTARSAADLGFFAERDGWRRVVDDVARLGAHARAAHPGVPLVLLGHSMGSFMVQQCLFERGETLAGAVLSGSTIALDAPEMLRLAESERTRLGPRGTSALLAAASFGAFNQPFAPARTAFDWLSRDGSEVDAYVADPLCGFPVSVQLWIDLLEAGPGLRDPRNLARIPQDLPLYVFAGDADPVNAHLTGLHQLLDAYRAAGLRRVTHRFYPGGRHEMLNEVNRDEVTDDLVAWLEGVVGAR
jgi:alpha-beta hydrolase superfamily lysophospholipase